jgi:hypothetical protein
LGPRIQRRIASCTDITSLSDELEWSARGWPERRRLSKSAANVLRAFDLGGRLDVLLVGGGYGAFARYLGETCRMVDVLEWSARRVVSCRARVADLDNVRVVTGDVDSLGEQSGYDLIVVVHAESDPGGDSGLGAMSSFFESLSPLMRKGGALLWIARNRLGVDRRGDFPTDRRHAYTTRAEIAEAMQGMGLTARFFSAFPDVLNARVVMADSLFARPQERSLCWRIPRFREREDGTSARLLWRDLVDEGVGPHFASAVVALAADPAEAPTSAFWPDAVEACFFTSQRRAVFMTKTVVRDVGGTLRFERSRLAGPDREIRVGGLTLRVADSDFVYGVDFADFARSAGANALRDALTAWRELVRQAPVNGLINIDLIPRNLVVGPDGEPRVIDEEFYHDDYEIDDVIARGVLDLSLSSEAMPLHAIRARTRREVALSLGSMVGIAGDGSLRRAIRREAELQAVVGGVDPGQRVWDRAVRSNERRLQAALGRPASPRSRARAWERARGLVSSLRRWAP